MTDRGSEIFAEFQMPTKKRKGFRIPGYALRNTQQVDKLRERLGASGGLGTFEIQTVGWPGIIARIKQRDAVQIAPGLKVRYAVIPARAVIDARIRGTALLVLAAIGLYVNRKGIAYPGMRTIGKHIHRSPSTVCRWITRLVQYGYLRRLVPVGPRYAGTIRRTSRYQLLVAATDIPPEGEREFFCGVGRSAGAV